MLLNKMINHGFFIGATDESELFPLLVGLLEGKSDEKEVMKFSKYEMNETNFPIMVTLLFFLIIYRKQNF